MTPAVVNNQPIEARYERTLLAYDAVRRRIEVLAEARIAMMVLEAYPDADTLHVVGEYNEDGGFIVRPHAVTASGQLVAGYTSATWKGPHGEDWNEFSDALTDLLDRLGDVTGEAYLNAQEIDLQSALDGVSQPPWSEALDALTLTEPEVHNTDGQPAVCVTSDGQVNIFGWVEFLTGEEADAYVAASHEPGYDTGRSVAAYEPEWDRH